MLLGYGNQQTIKTTKKYYAYALRYPDGCMLLDGSAGGNQIFYVGKGSKTRATDHIREARTVCNCRKCQIIRMVSQQGKDILIEILFESDIESDVLVYEWACIHYIHVGPFLINQEIMPMQRPKFYRYSPMHPLDASLYPNWGYKGW